MKIMKCKVLKPIYESNYGSFSKDWQVGQEINLTEERANALKGSVKILSENKKLSEKDEKELKKAQNKMMKSAKNK